MRIVQSAYLTHKSLVDLEEDLNKFLAEYCITRERLVDVKFLYEPPFEKRMKYDPMWTVLVLYEVDNDASLRLDQDKIASLKPRVEKGQ